MRIQVFFSSTNTSVLVPCGDGKLTVGELTHKAIVRYKKVANKVRGNERGGKGEGEQREVEEAEGGCRVCLLLKRPLRLTRGALARATDSLGSFTGCAAVPTTAAVLSLYVL